MADALFPVRKQADLGENFVDPGQARGAAFEGCRGVYLQLMLKHLLGSALQRQRAGLRHVTDVAPSRNIERLAFEQDFPLVRTNQAKNQEKGGGLTGPVAPEQAGARPRRE